MFSGQHSEETKQKIRLALTGRKHSAVWKERISKSLSGRKRPLVALNMLGEKNHMWAGDNVGYVAIHDYIKCRLKKPKRCEACRIKPAYDLANISGNYLRDLSDWQWLCRSCHMRIDGRMKNLRNQN